MYQTQKLKKIRFKCENDMNKKIWRSRMIKLSIYRSKK